MAKEIIIKRGDKIVCPRCGYGEKRWDGRSDYGFVCPPFAGCKAVVMMEIQDGRARLYVKELE